MEIAIVTGGMNFGPKTLDMKSLGGSEQAGLLICKALAVLGHNVTSFSNLPKKGEPDHCESGVLEDDVRWIDIENYKTYITSTEVDLLVVQRDFRMLNLPHQARKAVLWVHDLATYTWTAEGIQQLGTNFNEIWTVSEFHRQQFHKVTGYPLDRIKATRNGIAEIKTMDMGPRTKTLLFASRPERGLEHLVKEGGIMDMLKGSGFKLKVCMYANFPQAMEGYYNWLFGIINQRDDCEHMGSLTQKQLRQEMRNSFAYVYCADFEETSCLIARECIEQELPIICNDQGALPETVGKSGIIIKGQAKIGVTEPNAKTYRKFADAVLKLEKDKTAYLNVQLEQRKRKDLHWDGVAKQWGMWCKPQVKVSLFTRAWSLVQDSDIIPAIALIEAHTGTIDFATKKLYRELREFYRFLSFGKAPPEWTLKQHYDNYYKTLERPKTDLVSHDVSRQPRFQGLAETLKGLPDGSKVLDYACGEGSQMICLAKAFPNLDFYGIDISDDEVECAIRNAKKDGKPVGESNIKAIWHGTCDDWPEELIKVGLFDAAMANEVLEHVLAPWDLAEKVETMVAQGGRFILTVPQGAWELAGCQLMGHEQFKWRAHCWHIDREALRTMFGRKKNIMLARIPTTVYPDKRAVGNLVMSYEVDHKPIKRLNPLKKAKQANPRGTIGAAVIAMNAQQSILKMLDSIHEDVQVLQIALGPSTDMTKVMVEGWLEKHPWIYPNWIDVPRIGPPGKYDEEGFGFDDARNASVAGLDGITDWTFWIDTDEYLSGNLRKYATRHAFDAMAIHQHHFSCDPRGQPAQIDRPARMYRNGVGFTCMGKVHEHFEKGVNNGPGYCHLIQDVDIGHSGYINEDTRRARFDRNFPLLEWDRKTNPERKLGKFLWFRDIVHRMRYHQEINQPEVAGNLSKEGIEWYEEHRDAMDSFGNGTTHAFAYYGECLKMQGRGLGFDIMIKMTDPSKPDAGTRNASFGGVADDPDQLKDILDKMVRGEIEKRNSKYWR
ncbi:MAG: methyltransferase domain-containing protein [Nitrospiraceae bacterium]